MLEFIDAINKYDWGTISILVRTDCGVRAVSEANYEAGYCNCCSDFSIADKAEVVRVVDLQTMEILYSE